MATQPAQTQVSPEATLLPIFAEGGIGSRLLRAAESYAKDEYIFSPDEGSDHEPTEFEHMLFEDMLNGLFAHEPFAAILQEAARAALPHLSGERQNEVLRRFLEIALDEHDDHFGVMNTEQQPRHWTVQARKALASPPSPQGEWRDIATAPKDGTRFWGNEGDDAIAMFWHPKFEAFVSSYRQMTMAPGYTFNGEAQHDHSPEVHEPTHWRPLPFPPSTEQGEGK